MTLRQNTERPETITHGTNVLIGNDMELLKAEMLKASGGSWKPSKKIEKWDGKAGSRISRKIGQIMSTL